MEQPSSNLEFRDLALSVLRSPPPAPLPWPRDPPSPVSQAPSRLPFALEIDTATWPSVWREAHTPRLRGSLLLSGGVGVEAWAEHCGPQLVRVEQGCDHLHPELEAPGSIQKSIQPGPPIHSWPDTKNFSGQMLQSLRISVWGADSWEGSSLLRPIILP